MANETKLLQSKYPTFEDENHSDDFSRKMSIDNLEDMATPKQECGQKDQFELYELQRLTIMSACLTAFIFCVIVFSIYQRVKGIYI